MRPHLMVVWIGLGLATADAATRRVPEDHATIGDALDAAGPGDVVDVACGTYFEHDLELKSGVAVRSRSRQAGCVTIDAQELGRVAVGSDLEPGTELQGLTLVNGVSPVLLNGGALHLVASSLLLSNCELKFNRAEAQYFSTGSLGGAIYVEGGEELDVQECRFE
ncbi:MAG TPA: hypothetical protein VKU85_09910, partial [bacterium]|nr:hypothetical protein [bacterium]